MSQSGSDTRGPRAPANNNVLKLAPYDKFQVYVTPLR